MKTWRAFNSGVFAALVMALITMGLRAGGLRVNLAMSVGTIGGATPSVHRWIFGLICLLILGGLVAWVYAAAFEHVTHRAGWALGLGFGVIHFLIAGPIFGAIAGNSGAVHRGLVPAPGAYLSHLGAGAVWLFLVLHLIYGVLVGSIYGRVLNARLQLAPARDSDQQRRRAA